MYYNLNFKKTDHPTEEVSVIWHGLEFDVELACEKFFDDFSETEGSDWYILNLTIADSDNLVGMMKYLDKYEFQCLEEEAVDKLFSEWDSIQAGRAADQAWNSRS